MSTIALPSAFIPATFNLKSVVTQRVNSSNFGGSEQAIDLLNDRWMVSITVGIMTYDKGGEMEGYIASMRGQNNVSPLYHYVRPSPVGTIRGTLTLQATALQGASSITVTGCVPTTGTFKAGDMLGVGGLLLMVAATCTAVAGVVTIPLANRLRATQSAGTSVVWDKPTANFRLLSTSGVAYSGAIIEDTSFDFGEAI